MDDKARMWLMDMLYAIVMGVDENRPEQQEQIQKILKTSIKNLAADGNSQEIFEKISKIAEEIQELVRMKSE